LLKERLREILSSINAQDLIEPLESFLEKLIAEFKPLRVIIVGSLAKRKFIRGLSDIDILVVVNYEVPRDKRFILTSLRDVDVEITIVSRHELEKALEEDREFYVDAIKYGVTVFSSE